MEVDSEASSGSYALVLLGLGLGLGVLSIRARYQQKLEERNAGGEVVVTPDFKSFQTTFMSVYLCALLTEWFQAAFLFVALSEYHPERSVVRMYLAGVVSQLSLSTLLEVAGGFVPHKLRCTACLALQAGSAVLLLHPAFGGLVMSRVLGGCAAALLHSSFEAWMVEQHVGQGFPLDWFTHTFNKLSLAMSALAVALGPMATAAHDYAGGPLGPFKVSLVLTAINAALLFSWRRDSNKPCPACADFARLGSRAWAAVMAYSSPPLSSSGSDSGSGSGGGSNKVALVAVVQGCFEAATFAFALLWTPLLASFSMASAGGGGSRKPEEPPWGIVFSQQLACVMIGSVMFKLIMVIVPGARAERMCLWASAGGAICFFSLSIGGLQLYGTQCALLGYEVCVGLYLNAMGVMRSKYIPQEVRGLVLSVSKLVVTTFLFVLLVFFSESRSIATGLCGALLTVATVGSARIAGETGGGGDQESEEDEEAAALAQQRR